VNLGHDLSVALDLNWARQRWIAKGSTVHDLK